jgi:phosphoglycolate phosphatase
MTTGELADATVVFDLDGTLVDSAPDLVRALNQTLDLEGLARVKLETVRSMVGLGARALIERAAAFHGVTYATPRLDELTQEFISFYGADIARYSAPFPGVVETLEGLTGMGATLCVCTNKRTALSVQLLEALGLAHHFAAIVGADAVADRKPHPDHYRAAVERSGGRVERSLMVGDTSADVASARGAGAPVAVVAFGYSDVSVEKLGADVLLHRFSELTPACRRFLAARP